MILAHSKSIAGLKSARWYHNDESLVLCIFWMRWHFVWNYRGQFVWYLSCCLDVTLILDTSSSQNSSGPDTASVASSIQYHAEFTPLFSPEKFELPKAFFATAQSVRDSLIINWNSTYEYYERLNVKQAYYLSMEFLQVCHDLLNGLPLGIHWFL